MICQFNAVLLLEMDWQWLKFAKRRLIYNGGMMQAKLLTRFTTMFVPAEDRIRISALRSDNVLMVLWLTRRLTDRLIPMLVNWLEKLESGQQPVASEPMRGADDAALLKEFKLQSAQAQAGQERQQQYEEPVPAEAEDAEVWLIHRVDITGAPDLMTLVFMNEGNQPVALQLAPHPLRQWLDIFLTAYRQGEWPLDVWPSWIKDAAIPQAQKSAVVH